jgi:hypothetical protein
VINEIKEKLRLSINHKYQTIKNNSLYTILNDEELKEVEECLEFATKEELMEYIKVYHKEVKRIKLDVKEIIENE